MLGDIFTLEANTTRAGTDGEPGTGFGLRTVKHFVELFGGRLVITSRAEEEDPDDHGTTVEVHLRSAASDR
jgi:signal transduction histidine kinase